MLCGLLLSAVTAWETFDAPLRPEQWYVGVPKPPAKGALRIPKSGWIVSRGLPENVDRIEIDFRHAGGGLEVTFHQAKEPLSTPVRAALSIPKGKGARTLVVEKDRAQLDGEALPFKGAPTGTFRIAALKGAVQLLEVRVGPRPPPSEGPSDLEKSTVHLFTTPQIYAEAKRTYHRAVVVLWDVEVALLFRRGARGFAPLKAPPRGAPTLGVLATVSSARDWAKTGATDPLALRDWGDERGNLGADEFRRYLEGEYALFEVLRVAQKSLNAAQPPSKELDALVHLAVIRHADNARAAVALAQTLGGKLALKALKKAAGGADFRRMTGDRLRIAAGKAAEALLKKAPAAWPGFRFDVQDRYRTLSTARDLLR